MWIDESQHEKKKDIYSLFAASEQVCTKSINRRTILLLKLLLLLLLLLLLCIYIYNQRWKPVTVESISIEYFLCFFLLRQRCANSMPFLVSKKFSKSSLPSSTI
jgi:hypothetical protein